MTRRLLGSYLTITAFVLLIVGVPLAITYQRSEKERVNAALERDANTIGAYSRNALDATLGDRARAAAQQDLQRFLQDYASKSAPRATVVDRNGVTVADSSGPRAGIDRSRDPEIRAALGLDNPDGAQVGPPVHVQRYSPEAGASLLHVALPILSGKTLLGAVDMSYSVRTLEQRVHRNWLSLGFLAVVVLGSAAVVGAMLARSVTRPVRALELAAASLARGELGARAPDDDGPPEVRRLAHEFNDMARRLAGLIGAQRSFVADASHELRTPLTALRLRLENLHYAEAEEIPAEVDELSEEIGRLHRLVEGLLALARAEGQRPEREPVDVSAEVAARVDAWQALADEHDIHIVAESSHDVYALAVRGALAQILDNYLANALEVAPPGSRIDVRVERHAGQPGRVVVHVIDQGPGLAAAERARAFDRFWRGPGHDPGRSSGLGLAIVRQLAEASGGRAALEAAPSGGVDAIVVLRVSDQPPPPAPVRPAAQIDLSSAEPAEAVEPASR